MIFAHVNFLTNKKLTYFFIRDIIGQVVNGTGKDMNAKQQIAELLENSGENYI